MKIRTALIGVGRTGKIVANSLFRDRRFDFVFAVKKTPAKPKDFHFVVEPVDMLPQLISKFQPQIIVDFSTPQATLKNIKELTPNMGIVIATTGFTEKQINKLKKYKNLKVLYAPNISDGINILTKACKEIAKLWKEADVEIIEQHFKTKKDAPSGTAKKIAQIFDGQRIPIHAVRAGGITGIHSVLYAMPNQKITITHESFSREVFAQGAKRAILWLNKQELGFYGMNDVY